MLFSFKGFSQNIHLNIEGKTDKETETIEALNYYKTHSNYNSLKNEIDSIQKSLYQIGYIENKLITLRKINDSLFYSKINLRNKFDSIYIYYDSKILNQDILKTYSNEVTHSSFKLEFNEIKNTLDHLNNILINNGFPFSKLKLSNIESVDKNTLKANLMVSSTKLKRTIDKIKISGYEKFPKSYLKHYVKLKTSEVFDLNSIKQKTKQLNNLRFANQIKTPEVLFEKDSTTLYLYIKKAKSNTFDGFLGFGTNDQTNKLEFDGFLNLRLTNNLNFGESFSLLYKSDENDQDTFDVSLSLPYLFNSPIGVDLNLRIFKRDSSFTTVDQKARIHYQINPNHKVYAGISNTESNNLLSVVNTFSVEDYNSNYFTLAYEFIKPQNFNFLFPIKSSAYIEGNLGNRKTSNNKQKQTLITISTSNIFNLNNKNNIYIKADASNLISDNYFDNELLRFGGINSIRGFEENSLFASLFGVLNTEYRHILSNSIYIHTITDLAYFENKTADIKEKLFGYGFGFGILTKSGLLKFNYANGKSENQKFKLSNSKIHISLVARF